MRQYVSQGCEGVLQNATRKEADKKNIGIFIVENQ